MRSFLVLVACLVACKKSRPKPPPPPRFEGPMPVRFGDCAGADAGWVSGPRPLPFTPDEATSIAVAAPPPDAAAPASRDDEEAGGTGTAMALDEGKMGRKDTDRPEGQHKRREVRPSASDQQGGAFASLTGTGDVSSGLDDGNIYGGLLGNEAGEMQGGFGYGRSGFGPRGGGTGWGTIGTGRYGTIGHGSGTGTGYGVGGGRGGMRGRNMPVPTVSIGQPNVQGDLDKATVRRYIKRNIQKLQYCYEKQLLVKPGLAGTVAAQFFIAPDGTVASSSAHGVDPEVADCIAAAIQGIAFPRPAGGGVEVSYPFTFRPAGQAPPHRDAAPAPAPSPAAAGSGSATTSPAPASAPEPPAAAPPHVAQRPRELFRASSEPPVHGEGYTPGQANPLRGETDALAECFRTAATPYGAIVVGLTYDPAGEVSSATVDGLADERARACVVAVARRIKRLDHAPAAQRCSIAFGAMPASAMPGLDISPDAISEGGKMLASTPAVAHQDGPSIEEVVAAVEAGRKQAIAPGGPVVSIHGPLVIRPAGATPMQVVDRVLASVVAGGDDFVLAAAQGAGWRTLPAMELPVVPVPFGTGGRWRRWKSRDRDVAAIEEDGAKPVLSILVAQDGVWLGVSRANEFTEVKPGPDQARDLAKALADRKASALFADRTDVEIAGEAGVPYAEVVAVVDAATTAGFTGWRIATPRALAARPEK